MIEALYVPKSYGTYSDTCLMLGLACLAEYALGATGQKQGMQLIDEGTCYRIQFNKPMDLGKIESVSYVDLFPVVVWAENDTQNIPKEAKEITSIFSTEENIKISKLYSDWRRQNKPQWGEDAPDPPDARTQISSMIMSLNSTKNYLKLWQEAWKNREYFSDLLTIILETFSQKDILVLTSISERITQQFKHNTGVKLPKKINVIQIFRATAVDGSISTKSNSISSDKANENKSDYWISLWLIAKGLFEFTLVSSYENRCSTPDYRLLALNPINISLSRYRHILNEFRKYNVHYNMPVNPNYISKFDIEIILNFSKELLNYCPNNDSSQYKEKRNKKAAFISGVIGSHFYRKDKQHKIYGIENIFCLGLPIWIDYESKNNALVFHRVLSEHLSVIRSLDENQTEILAAYRDFITGTELKLFFPFQLMYANYCVKKLAKDEYVKLFSCINLDTMIMSIKKELKNIVENKGFEQIAKAINYATVRSGQILVKKGEAGKPYPKKDFEFKRFYGLAQRLGSRTSSRDDFISELSAFLTEYKSEYTRLESKLERGEEMLLSNVKASHIDDFLKLIDEWNNINLIANLLLAYGHSYWDR